MNLLLFGTQHIFERCGREYVCHIEACQLGEGMPCSHCIDTLPHDAYFINAWHRRERRAIALVEKARRINHAAGYMCMSMPDGYEAELDKMAKALAPEVLR